MPTVSIPTPLRPQAGGQASVPTEGETVAAALEHLAEQYPELRRRLFAAPGQLHQYVNIYLNNEDVRFLDDLDTAVTAADEISIIPAIAGG